MRKVNQDFFEEYKRLDKLCGEIYYVSCGITSYIDNMKNEAWYGNQYILNWEKDLKNLIRLRHTRNYLAHTEGAFDEKVCTQEDIEWLQNFYKRILSQSDPISLQYQRVQKEKQVSERSRVDGEQNEKASESVMIKKDNPVNKERVPQKGKQDNKENQGETALFFVTSLLLILLSLAIICTAAFLYFFR